jgi:hypothetical protein
MFNLWAWLTKQEQSAEKLIQKAFDEVKKDAAKVLPITAQISEFLGDVKAQNPSDVLDKAQTYLTLTTKGAASAIAFAEQYKGSLGPAIAHALAVAVATYTHSDLAKKATSYLDTVIQLAHLGEKQS